MKSLLGFAALAVTSALGLWLFSARADHICGPSGPTRRPSSEQDFNQMCRHCGGTPSGSGFSLRCDISSRSAPSESQPDYEAERRRQAEVERERQRQLEEQRQREAIEAKRKQEEFIRQRDEAVRNLRGVSPTDSGLKGVDTIQDRNTPLFGLRGVGETGIRDIKPDRETRDVSTAWKQLHCANELAQYALAAANRRDGGQVDLTEVRYLADESLKALNGEPIGVRCSDNIPAMPRVEINKDKLIPFYQTLLQAAVRQAEKLDSANRESEPAREREQRARERVTTLRAESPQGREQKPREKSKNDPITKAYEEQKAHQEKERKRIEEVYKEQKARQSAMEEAMAALREAQRAYNEVNSRKIQATNQLNQYRDLINRVLANPNQAAELQRRIN